MTTPASSHRRRQSSNSTPRVPDFSGLDQPLWINADSLARANTDRAGLELKSTSSSGRRRLSTSQPKRPQDQSFSSHQADVPASTNRWSHSTTSSISMGLNGAPSHDRKSSGHAKRFSIGTATAAGLGSPFGGAAAAANGPTSPSRKRRSSDLLSSSPSKSAVDSFGSSVSPPSADRIPPMTLPLFTSTSTAATSPMSPEKSVPNPGRYASPVQQDLVAPPKPSASYTIHSPIKRSFGDPFSNAPGAASSSAGTSRLIRPPSNSPLNSNSNPDISPKTAKSYNSTKSPPVKNKSHVLDSRQSNGSGGESSDMTATVRPKSRREKEKKAMLSRALQRANEAVLLDNDQEFVRALEAYQEACAFLEKVIVKSPLEEDKQRLAGIRATYVERIEELQIQEYGMNAMLYDSSKPTTESRHDRQLSIRVSDDEPVTRAGKRPGYGQGWGSATELDDETSNDDESGLTLKEMLRGPGDNRDALGRNEVNDGLKLAPPLEFTPRPLSPRIDVKKDKETLRSHHISNMSQTLPDRLMRDHFHDRSDSRSTEAAQNRPHSTASSRSSHHSVSSVGGVHRKPFRAYAGDTEAEFDAALDAAVEAAYDDGYEPYVEEYHDLNPPPTQALPLRPPPPPSSRPPVPDVVTRSLNVVSDRERVISEAKNRIAARQRMQQPSFNISADLSDPESGIDSDEEERLLEEAGKDFSNDAARPSAQSKRLPRQSDSSQSSGRTWGSSVTSSLNTAGTPLSTLDESNVVKGTRQRSSTSSGPSAPPPKGALPLPPLPTISKPVLSSPSPAPPPAPINPPVITPAPAPTVPAPAPPSARPSLTSSTSSPNLAVVAKASVQDRRGSNQGAKKLKIETASLKSSLSSEGTLASDRAFPSMSPTSEASLIPPKTATGDVETDRKLDERYALAPLSPSKLRFITSPFPSPLPPLHSNGSSTTAGTTVSPPTPALSSAMSNDSSMRPSPQSPMHPLSKTLSAERSGMPRSNALNPAFKNKTHLSPSSGENFETSPGTPMSFAFHALAPANQRVPMNTPVAATFGAGVHRPPPSKNSNFLGDDLHPDPMPSPYSPRYDRSGEGPRPLEACPEHYLLRPYWLLRCIYQTIANPRGGYITKKLFIPREIWKVKNVKLKGVEEKIAVCDLLTAALLKLGAVDTLDADAVLEEMQAFESILDQAQMNLAKKLGHDVGVSGVTALFKDAPVSAVPTPTSATSGSTLADGSAATLSGSSNHHTSSDGTSSISTGGSKTGSKSYLSSWRKLRTKGSSTALASAYTTQRSDPKENMLMATVPMTSSAAPPMRFTKAQGDKGVLDAHPDGPNAGYMNAMARLCDAAQILDHIARQVEDPGLKLSSTSYVGLELSTRHAAEFFGFYICRFALQDITMLADKFVKRAIYHVLSCLEDLRCAGSFLPALTLVFRCR